MKKRMSKYRKILLILLAAAAVLNLLGCIPAFCDLYTDSVYRFLADGIGYVTGLLPFPLCELLMYAGILIVLASVIFAVLLIFLRKKQGWRSFCRGWYRSVLMTLVCVVFLYTSNWLVPFRGTVLGQGVKSEESYSYEQVRAFREYVYTQCNAAAELVPTDSEGNIIFPDGSAITAGVTDAMHGIADRFPRLRGYYPPIKTALCSDILNRMGIGGFTYPLTLELTHNKYCLDPVFQPVLDAHEQAHHKGYYKENEADFLSEVALSESADPFLRFCGFWAMTGYAEDALTQAFSGMAEDGSLPDPQVDLKGYANAINEIYRELTPLSAQAWEIYNQANGIRQEIYEQDSHPIDSMPAVNEAIEKTADVGWSTQADILKENIYDGAVALLLRYYCGSGRVMPSAGD